MSHFTIRHSNHEGITQISNRFIDTFMPSANGSFVKVYLYLLRHRETTDVEFLSVHAMADLFENTEADIMRALRYWQKKELLDLECDTAGQVVSITLLPLISEHLTDDYAAAAESPLQEVKTPDYVSASVKVPPMPNYEPAELAVLGEDIEVQEARTIIETMMGAPITEPYLNVIIYFLSELGFSLELTIQAFETALSKGKRSPRYIEKIGFNWAEKGIKTAAEAENEAASFDTHYNIVKNHLGLNRNLAPAERTIIDGWKQYHFTDTILAEACKRTIFNIGKPNLNYTGKILKEWHDVKVTSLKDIETLDKARKAKVPAKPASQGNRFQNFPQRNYSEKEYSAIEKQLLGKS